MEDLIKEKGIEGLLDSKNISEKYIKLNTFKEEFKEVQYKIEKLPKKLQFSFDNSDLPNTQPEPFRVYKKSEKMFFNSPVTKKRPKLTEESSHEFEDEADYF